MGLWGGPFSGKSALELSAIATPNSEAGSLAALTWSEVGSRQRLIDPWSPTMSASLNVAISTDTGATWRGWIVKEHASNADESCALQSFYGKCFDQEDDSYNSALPVNR
ncbi:hypothetical protein AYO22_03965 [Fonsecaea multimorphosa]|nr:hypothetical protein AYO22_03965 [Fonsecaea multimorphosa]